MPAEANPISGDTTAHLSKREIEDRVREIHAAAKERPLTVAEKIFLLETAKFTDVRIKNEPSVRREDWYGNDGR